MTTKMTTTKAQNYECCMCGDLGLSLELFRCNVCRFRSQHRYCSNLYPKAETYKVCNWCLIQKNDNHTNTTTTTTTITSNNSSDTSSPATNKHNKSYNNITNNKMYDHLGGPRAGPGPKGLQPTSPIKKPMIRSMESQTPSGRKRITAVDFAIKDDRLRRTKSSQDMTKNNNNNSKNNSNNNSNLSSNSRSNGQGVIKHVFRNKVRRYKLLDEVSS